MGRRAKNKFFPSLMCAYGFVSQCFLFKSAFLGSASALSHGENRARKNDLYFFIRLILYLEHLPHRFFGIFSSSSPKIMRYFSRQIAEFCSDTKSKWPSIVVRLVE
ncbi:hypothetical protein CEXT_194391 [Caerostris extrusa]|uniref:Secreted protein n=1 Tax=Caerostris extrusa TaxID=172846 RepID=A0AAV4MKY4_CAEEX|nr:hypothetical protein CEXT_194391 [Caerostris extrusa]